MWLIFSLFFILAVAGFAFTKQLIIYARKNQLLDIANHRSSHIQATPRIGGISFVVIISIVLFSYALIIAQSAVVSILTFILLPALIVAFTGLFDDLKGLAQYKRFILYFLSSVIALGNIPFLLQPSWLTIILAFIASLSLTWIINLFNFMDGIDGIAASESIFVLSALTFFGYQGGNPVLSIMLMLAIAPILGFTVLNWQPAKIFMGDIGSTFLGCLIGCLLFYYTNEKLINIYVAVILLASFAVDTTWTLIYRLASGQKWYEAHRSHAYQILSRKFSSHQKVTLIYSLVNICWLFPLALAANQYSQYALLITTISVLPLLGLCFIIGAGKSTLN